jgi:hypothetical protein
MHRRHSPVFVVVLLLAAACSSSDSTGESRSSATATTSIRASVRFGEAPTPPEGPLARSVATDLDIVFESISTGLDIDAVTRLGASDDVRVAWLLTDILRFVRPGSDSHGAAIEAWEELTGRLDAGDASAWGNTTNHLLAWDTPAPPGYINWKRQIFELIEPGWAPFFDDDEATIDWRQVSWGGVLIDDRPLDQTNLGCPEGCIPALDDPALTDAEGGDWYGDDRVVFGVLVGDEAVALPKNIMEIHEMVNMTLDGRRIGIPYCTLCGSAQAYFTDEVPPDIDLSGNSTFELRTSGLLARSNKVMYEFHTRSVFDTFTGEAVTGPLREQGVALEQLTVQTSTWGDWKAAHPDTRIVAEDGGIGRTYAEDPLGGRDDDGPIFPIGDTDPRLPIQESVVGVVNTEGTPVAFPASTARDALDAGVAIEAAGVRISSDGGGFTAVDAATGDSLATHQAFWFAWSQFHPETLLWDGS